MKRRPKAARVAYVLVWDAREPAIPIDARKPDGPHLAVPEISWWTTPASGPVPVLFTRTAANRQEREDREERPDDGQVVIRVQVLGDPPAPGTVYKFEDGREFTLALLRRAAGYTA